MSVQKVSLPLSLFFAFFIPLLLVNFVMTRVSAQTVSTSPYVSASGTKLYLNGEKYQFTGVNAFNIATYPGSNAGCGSYVSDLDAFFSKLRPNSAVRMWAFQGSMAVNPKTKEIDWSGLDRVVNAAQRNGKKLILVLGDQSGHCDDGHWKDKSWYESGYKQAFNDTGNGLTPLPYIDYVKLIVARYKDSTAIAMWEPINEPAASDCTNGKKGFECYANQVCSNEESARDALRTFFDSVGGAIRSIDSKHLISSGVIGDGQCGAIWEDYKYIHESPGIDVASYHDYQRDDEPMPGDQWNGLQKRLDQMALLNKPLIIGEVGMLAHDGISSCMSYSDRHNKMKAKMDAQFAAGISGFLPWSYTNGTSNICNYDIVDNDPVLALLRNYPVAMSSIPAPAVGTMFPEPVRVPDITPPTAPNLTVAVNSSTNATLMWSGATDDVGVARYDIYRDYSYITSTTGTSIINTTLTAGKTYKYYVKAKDSAGNSSVASNMVTVTTPGGVPIPPPEPKPEPVPDTQAPSAPSLVSSINSQGQVVLNWQTPYDNVGVVRYDIYRDYSYLTSTGGTTLTNTVVIPGSTYKYYIKAKDAAGNVSPASNILAVTVPGGTPPPPPPEPKPTPGPDTQAPTAPVLNVTVNSATGNIDLNWGGSTDNVGVIRYDIYRNYMYLTSTTLTNLTNTTIQPSTKYMYYVKAKDLAGNVSTASNKVTITTSSQ